MKTENLRFMLDSFISKNFVVDRVTIEPGNDAVVSACYHMKIRDGILLKLYTVNGGVYNFWIKYKQKLLNKEFSTVLLNQGLCSKTAYVIYPKGNINSVKEDKKHEFFF